MIWRIQDNNTLVVSVYMFFFARDTKIKNDTCFIHVENYVLLYSAGIIDEVICLFTNADITL